MSIPATALMITWPVDQNVPRTISLHQCSIRAGSCPTSSSREVVDDPDHPPAVPGQARLADPRQPLVGPHQHDDDGVRVAGSDPTESASMR